MRSSVTKSPAGFLAPPAHFSLDLSAALKYAQDMDTLHTIRQRLEHFQAILARTPPQGSQHSYLQLYCTDVAALFAEIDRLDHTLTQQTCDAAPNDHQQRLAALDQVMSEAARQPRDFLEAELLKRKS